MPENKEYWTSQSERGNVKISEDVIATIVSVATVETEGVSNIATSITTDLVGILGKKNTTNKGIKVVFNYDEAEVDVAILVNFGVVVFDVAKAVQSNIKSAIESMTGLSCKFVNVSVAGISFEK